MKNATRILTSTLGALVGFIALEHGVGEILQGNRAPGGVMILSWPGSRLFQILGGEPAMTIIPNLLVTGILAVIFSLIFLGWATLFVERRNGGLVLMLLSLILLLVGGGIFPPIFGAITGLLGTRINAPLSWWRAHLPAGVRPFLERLWPWSFGACLLAWLSMFPGTLLLWHFFSTDNPGLIWAILIGMFGFLFTTIITGFAHDLRLQTR